MPGEVTRILVPFGANIPGFNAAGGPFTAFQASHLGDYVWHCHILEHEDNDMMQRYVIDPPIPDVALWHPAAKGNLGLCTLAAVRGCTILA